MSYKDVPAYCVVTVGKRYMCVRGTVRAVTLSEAEARRLCQELAADDGDGEAYAFVTKIALGDKEAEPLGADNRVCEFDSQGLELGVEDGSGEGKDVEE